MTDPRTRRSVSGWLAVFGMLGATVVSASVNPAQFVSPVRVLDRWQAAAILGGADPECQDVGLFLANQCLGLLATSCNVAWPSCGLSVR